MPSSCMAVKEHHPWIFHCSGHVSECFQCTTCTTKCPVSAKFCTTSTTLYKTSFYQIDVGKVKESPRVAELSDRLLHRKFFFFSDCCLAEYATLNVGRKSLELFLRVQDRVINIEAMSKSYYICLTIE